MMKTPESIAIGQGWDEDTRLGLAEDFITSKSLERAYVAYLAAIAEAENDDERPGY